MDVKLSTGIIRDIFTGQEPDAPILQVLNFRVIQAGNQSRYRMIVSDGQFQSGSSMLATQLNDLVNTQLTPFSIFRADRYVCNKVTETKTVFIILDLTVLVPGDRVGSGLGNPVMFDLQSNGNAPAASNPPAVQSSSFSRIQSKPGASNTQQSSAPPVGVHPISSLTPYQNKWTICARVTNKSSIRTWSNSRGQGKLFSMDLLDESGEIRATGFNDECDKFYDMVEINKVYYISQAQLKTANKQYSSLKNDYEMTFNQGSQVTLCQDTTSIPTMQFEFVTIEQLENVEKDAAVDVIGVCKNVEDVATIMQKSTGKELKKRDLQIMDQSGKEIRLTLWANQAETFDGVHNPVLALKGVKVSDFNGKSLSFLTSSAMQINPDITEAHRLRSWFDNTGVNLQSVNLSNQKGMSGGNKGGSFKTVAEAINEKLGCGDQADYYTTKASVTFLRKENSMYPACPSENCNKKVVDMNNGVYRCEKCNQEYDNFNWRLMLNANLADGTESVWVTLFNETAEKLLGQSAADLGALKDNDPNAYAEVFADATFKEVIAKIRVKMDTFNDEKRLKSIAMEINPVNLAEYNANLLQQIKKMACLV